MNKKLLLLSLLFCATETKPVVVEVLACIGAAAVVRSKTVQFFSKFVFQKFRNALPSREFRLGASMPQQAAKLENVAPQIVEKMRKQALIRKEQMAACLVAFKARAQALGVKNPFTTSVEQTATHSFATGQWQQVSSAAQAGQKVDVTVNNAHYAQKVSGLFPRVTNIFQAGDSKLLVQEIGKKKFWKGVCLGSVGGSVGTAWLLKKNEQRQEEK